MPLPQAFIHYTGGTRLRRGWLGTLIVQIELTGGRWIDADEAALKSIGFECSSIKARGRQEAGLEKPLPPADELGIIGGGDGAVRGLRWA